MSDGWWSKLTDAEREAICKRKSERYWAARQEHGYFTSKGKPETLCWSCQRAVRSKRASQVDLVGWSMVAATQNSGSQGPGPRTPSGKVRMGTAHSVVPQELVRDGPSAQVQEGPWSGRGGMSSSKEA